MDLGVYIWPAACCLLILFTRICCIIGQAIEQGIRKTYVNAGGDATLVFSGFGTKIDHQKCDIKRYEIWARGTDQLKRIFASKSGNGMNAMCVGDCNVNSKRGSILNDSKNVSFTLANATKADQKRYCLTIKCYVGDDINSNCENEIALVIFEPVTRLNHTLIGLSPVVKLGDTIQAICTADGDPPPDMKIINNNTGETIKEDCTNNLSYSFEIKQRQRQVSLICEAKNNPETKSISQVLRVDVNYTTSQRDDPLKNSGEKIDYFKSLSIISVMISVCLLTF